MNISEDIVIFTNRGYFYEMWAHTSQPASGTFHLASYKQLSNEGALVRLFAEHLCFKENYFNVVSEVRIGQTLFQKTSNSKCSEVAGLKKLPG